MISISWYTQYIPCPADLDPLPVPPRRFLSLSLPAPWRKKLPRPTLTRSSQNHELGTYFLYWASPNNSSSLWQCLSPLCVNLCLLRAWTIGSPSKTTRERKIILPKNNQSGTTGKSLKFFLKEMGQKWLKLAFLGQKWLFFSGFFPKCNWGDPPPHPFTENHSGNLSKTT